MVDRRRAISRSGWAFALAVALLSLTAGIASGAGSLGLSPDHGLAGDGLTVTYSTDSACRGETVRFGWDGGPLTDAALDGSCRATVDVTPPSGADGEGRHVVTGCYIDASGACLDLARGVYVIDPPPPPPPTPAPTPKPTSKPKPKATPKPTPAPTPKPTPAPTAAPTAAPAAASAPTPTPSPAATPTATLSPTPTATPTATPPIAVAPAAMTPSSSPTSSPSPTGAVLAATAVSGQGAAADPAFAVSLDDVPVSDLVASVPGPWSTSTDLAVLGTNLALTIVVLLTFGLTSSVFNSTIKSNRDEIDGWVGTGVRRLRPITHSAAAMSRRLERVPGQRRLARPARIMLVLALTGLVYGFLSPDFGPDAGSLVLFGSIVLGAGFVTYLSEGGGAFMASRYFGATATVRPYKAAIVIAVACVGLTRLMAFQPGIMYGFIASNVIVASVVLDRRREASLVLVPTFALLVASLVAWIAIPIATPIDGSSGPWWQVLLQAALVTVFVAGIEGAFYALIPITFMDGATVFEWDKRAWAVAFGIVTFLFWHLLLNTNDAYLDALRQTRVAMALGLVILYSAVTVATWLFFKVRTIRPQRLALEV